MFSFKRYLLFFHLQPHILLTIEPSNLSSILKGIMLSPKHFHVGALKKKLKKNNYYFVFEEPE